MCNPIFLGSHQAVYSNWYRTTFFLDVELTSIYHHYYGYCDIVVSSKKYIFGLHPHSQVMTAKRYLCYVNKVIFGKDLMMGAGCQENQPRD